MLNNYIYNKLFRLYQQDRFKEILDLCSLNIKIEKTYNKPTINCIYLQDNVIYSLNALIWFQQNPNVYERYNYQLVEDIKTIKNMTNYNISKEVVKNLYKDVIKNKILMI
jgi:hypothetical protein